MKSKIFITFVFLFIFSKLYSFSVVLEGESIMQETGYYSEGRAMMILDSMFFNKVKIEIFESSATIHTTIKQEFSFKDKKITEDISKHYIITFEAVDKHDAPCSFVIYMNKQKNTYIIVVSYKDRYLKYWMHKK